jgi:hypothetical protein
MNLLKIFLWSPNLEFILCNIWIKRFMTFSWTESEREREIVYLNFHGLPYTELQKFYIMIR